MAMQYIEFSPVIQIPIPDDKILVDAVEFKELKSAELLGQTWDSKDVTKRLGCDIRNWKIVFYRYRKVVDVNNGGFVKFPTKKGMPWKFNAKPTATFIDKHWREFMETKDI
jgi:phage pi2 protein 07